MRCGGALASHGPLIVLASLLLTAAALALARVLSDVVGRWAATARARRRAEARADEVALLGAAAQQWLLTPVAWGGAPSGSFAGVQFSSLGRTALPLHAGCLRTAAGRYRLVHVPPCAALDRVARRFDVDPGRDGLLVIGWDEVTFEACAALVLGPLVQVPLARVPWGWVGTLVQREAARPRLTRRVATPTAAPDRPAAPARWRTPTPAGPPILTRRPAVARPVSHPRRPPRDRARARSPGG